MKTKKPVWTFFRREPVFCIAFLCAVLSAFWVPPSAAYLSYIDLRVLCLLFCLAFQFLPLGWPRRFLRLVGENSLEIYLLNVTLFSRYDLLRQYVSFGPTNRLYFLLSYAVNIALGVLLHKVVEGLRALYQQRKERKLSTPAV